MAAEGPTAREPAWRESDDDDARRATRMYMLVRSLAGPAAAAYAVSSPGDLPAAFWGLFAAGHVLGFAAVAVASSARWRILRPEITLPLDVAVLATLIALSGGAQSQLRDLVIVMMIAPAIVMSPRVVAITGVGVLFAYLAVALPDVFQHERGAASAVVAYVLGLGWATGAAVTLSGLRVAVSVRVASLLRGRRVLLAGVLDLEARERRRLTEDIHEGPLQSLLAASQDLEEVREGSADALARAERGVGAAIEQLRETIAGVHPVALEHGGLAAGLRAVAERAALRGGFQALVTVDPAAAGLRDEVVVNVARELITNVVEHAQATTLDVTVSLAGGMVVLEITDDGTGFAPEAVRSEAVGLASCQERVAAADGRFSVASAPGRGTRVRVELPPPPARRGRA